MERMGGQYSIDVAGFVSTTDGVASALESLGQSVSGAVADLDEMASATSGAEAAVPLPRTSGTGRREALVR